jgi:predicted O-linked N-acetylglucosamine transferase (SPINDLY family)
MSQFLDASNPAHAESFFQRAGALASNRQYAAALDNLDIAVRLAPRNAGAWCNRGNALRELNRIAEALDSYKESIALNPNLAEAHANRAAALFDLKRYDEAASGFQAVVALNPNYVFALGNLLKARIYACNWDGIDQLIERIRTGISSGVPVCSPFVWLMVQSTPEEQLACANVFSQLAGQAQAADRTTIAPRSNERIRIGYFSSDFYNHATAYLLAEMIECHENSRYDILLFSYGPNTRDEMQQRLMAAASEFIDVSAMSDQDITALARSKRLDLAIDLKGHTTHTRQGPFIRRMAPVQAHYLGFPGTLGLGVVDYLIADSVLITPADRQFYAEKIAYLPNSYQVNDSKRSASGRGFSRADCGLPETAFVFCCFNNNYKISPQSADVWARILLRVPQSVLWLLADNPTAEQNLRRELRVRGIADDRLIFAQRMPHAAHLARHACADVFVDTFNCGAHTTASDALWAGLPVLTLRGPSFAGRVAASLLHALDLPEMVTESQTDFENFAVALAQSPQRLAEIRAKLCAAKHTRPLFDTPRITRDIESLYDQMVQRSRSGLPPDHLFC